MNWLCYYCDENIDSDQRDYTAITTFHKNKWTTGGIHFHNHCFVDVAGQEYVDVLAGDLTDYNVTPEEMDLIKQAKHIPAIKSIRDRTGLLLKESKDLADRFRDSLGPNGVIRNRW